MMPEASPNLCQVLLSKSSRRSIAPNSTPDHLGPLHGQSAAEPNIIQCEDWVFARKHKKNQCKRTVLEPKPKKDNAKPKKPNPFLQTQNKMLKGTQQTQ